MEIPEEWKQYPLASDFTEYEFSVHVTIERKSKRKKY